MFFWRFLLLERRVMYIYFFLNDQPVKFVQNKNFIRNVIKKARTSKVEA